ncbi:MAG: hypothetical protein Q8Q20_00880 [bacterium]|nr:hypothetical protein [bacterium]
MPATKIELSPLLLHNPQTGREDLSVMIAKPTAAEEAALGRLFMLFRVSPGAEPTQRLVAAAIEETKTFYYSQLESNAELAFETTLKHLNEFLSRQFENQSAEWLNDFHAIIGVIRNSDLFFSQVGDLQAFYINRRRVVGILEKTQAEGAEINPLKIFSQTISGQLSADDALVFGTSSLLDYLSLDRIKSVVLEAGVYQAVQSLERLLLPNSAQSSFAAIIIKLSAVTMPESDNQAAYPYRPTPANTQDSMNQLVGREQSTNQLLSPSTWSYFKQLAGNFGARGKKLIEKTGVRPKTQHQRPNQNMYYTPVRETQRPARQSRYPSRWTYILSRLFRGIEWFFRLVKNAFTAIIDSISGRKRIKQKLQHLPTNATQTVSKRVLSFQKLTRQRKIILIVAVLVIFIFAQSIILNSRRKEAADRASSYESAITQAQAKSEEAEAALLYGDEDGARNLLSEATALLTTIPEKEQEKKYSASIAGIENSINALFTRTKHINEIQDPTVLVNFSDALEGFTPAGFVGLLNNELIAYSADKVSVAELGLEENNTAEIIREESEGTPSLAAPLSANDALIGLSDRTLVEYDAVSNTFTPLTITYQNQDTEFAAIATYLNRAYFLDTKNNQIFRHQRAANAYASGVGWVNDENPELTDAVSMAIDGSVYVLHRNGNLSKFSSGALDQEFSLSTIDPALDSGTKVFTTTDTEYIYILDTDGRRLLVFSKQGRLLNQYTSGAFDNLKDFAIDEANKKAYILNSSTVYQVDLLES